MFRTKRLLFAELSPRPETFINGRTTGKHTLSPISLQKRKEDYCAQMLDV